MYLARFSYDIAPKHRDRALQSMEQELESARKQGLEARILIPLTRSHGGPALQFEVALTSLDQLEKFRHGAAASRDDTSSWMQAFSEILTAPPAVEILRVQEPQRSRKKT
jgi:hypothetical protein